MPDLTPTFVPAFDGRAYAVVVRGLYLGFVFKGVNEWVCGSYGAKTRKQAAQYLIDSATEINQYEIAAEMDEYFFAVKNNHEKIWDADLPDIEMPPEVRQ